MLRRLTIGLSILLLAVEIGASEIPKVTVEFFPPTLEIPDKGSVEMTVVVRNPSDYEAKQLSIKHTGLKGLTVKISPSEKQKIPARGTFVWTLEIDKEGNGRVAGNLNLLIHYTRTKKDKTEINDVVVKTIAVASRDQEDTSKIVDVVVHSTLAELNEFRPGYIYLEIANKSVAPVKITDVIISERPSFIIIKPSSDEEPFPVKDLHIIRGIPAQIPPNESHIFVFYIASGGDVRPGEHMLVFNVMFQRNVNGETRTGSVVKDYKIRLKVFGEEEILGVFASVTTFLFVPGFLMIVVLGMLWKPSVPDSMKEKFPFSLKASTIVDPRFWVIAITLSLLMVWQIYPALSEGLLRIGRRNFLHGYGFQDIFWMWLLSIAIGGIISMLIGLVMRAFQKIAALREEAKWKRAIKPTDKAMIVLEKIIEKEFDKIRFNKIKMTASGNQGFLIEPDRPGKTKFWFIPRITIWWREEAAEQRDAAEELIANKDASLADLFSMLQQVMQDNGITRVEWATETGYVDKPTRADRSDIEISTQTDNVFLLKWEDN